METTSGDDNKPQSDKQEPLPLRNTDSAPAPKQVLESASQSPIFQENIAGKPSEETPNDCERKELGEFERLSLRWARLNAVFVGLTLIAITGTAVVFWDQFKEMSSQTDLLAISARQARRDSAESSVNASKQLAIAHQQADAAEKGVKAIQTQMRQDQRAWVEITMIGDTTKTPIDPRQPIVIPLKITNAGKTRGIGIKIRAEVEVVSKNAEPTFKYTKYHGVTGMIYKDQSFEITADTHMEDKQLHKIVDRPLGQADYDDLNTGRSYIVYFASVRYKDIFGIEHWTHFCGWHAYVTGAFTAGKCTAYNGADNN
jgi:hypothetical protein